MMDFEKAYREVRERAREVYCEDEMLEHGGACFWREHRNRVKYYGTSDLGGNRHYAMAVGGVFVATYGYSPDGTLLYVWCWEPQLEEELWVDRILPHMPNYRLVGTKRLSDMMKKGEI